MKCIRIICVICGLLLSSAGADGADDIILRTSVSSEKDIWVGQKVVLYVDVLAKDGWGQIKKVRDVEIPGAIALRVQTQGSRNSETVEGSDYSGQRYEVLLFPQRGGSIIVPAIPVDVEVKTLGTGAGSEMRRMKTPPLEFQVRTQPGAARVDGLVSTTKLSLEQTWDPEPGSFKVGDAVKRTIVVQAADVAGMAFAPLGHDEISGVGVYPSEPEVSDRVERGELISGKRVETVTYVFVEQGSVSLPSINVAWWDLEQKSMMLAELPPLNLEIAANPAAAGTELEAASESPRAAWVTPTVAAALILLAVALMWSRFGVIKARLRERRVARNEREAAYFRRALEAACADEPATTLTALMAWLDRRAPPGKVGSLEAFLSAAGMPKLTEQVRALESRVCGIGTATTSVWSPEVFCRQVRRAKTSLDHETRRHKRVHASALPAFNPDTDAPALPTIEKRHIMAEI